MVQLAMLTGLLLCAGNAGASQAADTIPCKHILAQNKKWPGLSVSIPLPCNWVVDTGYSATHLAIIKGVDKKLLPWLVQ